MFLCTFFLRKIHKNVAARAALYGSNMHQIVCRLGLCPRPHRGSSQRSPDSLAGSGRGVGPPGKREEKGRGKGEGRKVRGGDGGRDRVVFTTRRYTNLRLPYLTLSDVGVILLCLRRSVWQFYLLTPRSSANTERIMPAFSFPAEAGPHLSTPEGWKAELA